MGVFAQTIVGVRLGVRLRQLQHALGVDEVDILGARIVQQLLERVAAHLVRARVRRAADARVSVLLQYLVPELDTVIDVEGQRVARQLEAVHRMVVAPYAARAHRASHQHVRLAPIHAVVAQSSVHAALNFAVLATRIAASAVGRGEDRHQPRVVRQRLHVEEVDIVLLDLRRVRKHKRLELLKVGGLIDRAARHLDVPPPIALQVVAHERQRPATVVHDRELAIQVAHALVPFAALGARFWLRPLEFGRVLVITRKLSLRPHQAGEFALAKTPVDAPSVHDHCVVLAHEASIGRHLPKGLGTFRGRNHGGARRAVESVWVGGEREAKAVDFRRVPRFANVGAGVPVAVALAQLQPCQADVMASALQLRRVSFRALVGRLLEDALLPAVQDWLARHLLAFQSVARVARRLPSCQCPGAQERRA
eukprot:scaffold81145_cov64-Phaeocystis_antarctica.AAC.2